MLGRVVLGVEAQRHVGLVPDAGAGTGLLVVVHAPDDVGARLELHAEAVVVHGRVVARRDAAERPRDDVVHDRATRPELDRLHPARLGQLLFGDRGGEVDVLILDVVLDEVLLAHVENQIRLTDGPAGAFRPLLGRRRVGRVACRRAGLGPAHQQVDLVLPEGPLIGEDTVLRIGSVPRRHQPGLDLPRDRPRPGACAGVVGERHRCHHAAEVGAVGTMADLAVLLENRKHVAVEGRHLGIRLGVVGRHRHGGECEDEQGKKCTLHEVPLRSSGGVGRRSPDMCVPRMGKVPSD